MAYLSRFLKPASDHFFLLGPRGTGKTFWTEEVFPGALKVNLLDPALHREFAARPERLEELVLGNPDAATVVVDEVQKLPALLEVVHKLIEAKTGQQFVLTGSSARKLRRAGVNLLGGRALKLSMHPYMASELGDQFDFNQALECGLVPVVLAAKSPKDALEAYNGLYLREEVQMEGLVRDIGAFARFLEAMSFSHGSVLNLSNVSRECAVSRKTCEGYLEILEDLLLGYRLPVFTKKARRELAGHPKFYFFDTGVFRANRPSGPLDQPQEIEGAALEGLVAQHLHGWCNYNKSPHQLYYWQTRSKVEVDFVVYGPSGLYTFEVKNTSRVRSEDLSALKTFSTDYPEAKCALLYRGKERLMQNGILCIPVEPWLRQLDPSLPPLLK